MKPRTQPEGGFVALIAAINRGAENEIVDEATRLVRARLKSKSRHAAQKAK
jgi:hypothetical protein